MRQPQASKCVAAGGTGDDPDGAAVDSSRPIGHAQLRRGWP